MSSTETGTWRRQRAWALKEVGWEQQRIAEALGVTEGAVSQRRDRNSCSHLKRCVHRFSL